MSERSERSNKDAQARLGSKTTPWSQYFVKLTALFTFTRFARVILSWHLALRARCSAKKDKKNKNKGVSQKKKSSSSGSSSFWNIPDELFEDLLKPAKKGYNSEQGQLLRKLVAVTILLFGYYQGNIFKGYVGERSLARSEATSRENENEERSDDSLHAPRYSLSVPLSLL